ncbi:MAG: arylsulfatase, partial [Pirellulales bacterium]|nr:arylsulfatase [Pirellulales bacterium]
PTDRIIDGRSIWPLMTGESGAVSPHDVFYCYYDNELRAIRDNRWKLLFPHQSRTLAEREGGRDGYPVQYDQQQVGPALYDLDADVGETKDVSAEHPEEVARLTAAAEVARDDLGDSLTGRKGKNIRPPGRIPEGAKGQ